MTLILLAMVMFFLQPIEHAVAGEVSYLGTTRDYQSPAGGSRTEIEEYAYRGDVEEGDLDKLKKIMPAGAWEGYIRVNLESDGGNFVEALKIGRYFWDRGVPTRIQAGKRCLSACAIIFMSGSSHGGDGLRIANLELHATGTLGFHAPFLLPEQLADVPQEQAGQLAIAAYKTALNSAVEFLRLQNLAGWPPTLIAELLAIQDPKSFIYVDTIDKARRWNIGVSGVRSPPFNRAMLPLLCGNPAYWEKGETSPGRGSLIGTDWRGMALGLTPDQFTIHHNGPDKTLYRFDPDESETPWCHVEVRESEGTASITLGSSTYLLPIWGGLGPQTKLATLAEEPSSGGSRFSGGDDRGASLPASGGRWNHNNSSMDVQITGNNLRILYEQPRPGMLRAGARPGSLLVDAQLVNGQINGDARLFNSRCGEFTYRVSGTMNGNNRIELRGRAPRVRPSSCQIFGYRDDHLVFERMPRN